MFEYPVDIFKESNGSFTVGFPDVPEAHTFGDTRDEALLQAVDALESAFSFYVEDNKPLPKPSPKRNRPTVSPSLIGTMKLGIYQAMRDGKVRKTDLARRLKCHLMQIDRLLDLTHSSRIDQLEAAYAALGMRVNVVLEAAE